MRILLTGSTGFIGRHVAQRLVGAGYEVRCLVRRTADLRPLQLLPVEVWAGDVTAPDTLSGALEDVQAVAHLVGIIKERPPHVTFPRVHVEGAQNMLQAAKAAGVGRFLLLSAIGARPDRAYPYLMTKWQGEDLVRASGLSWTVLRSSIVYGEGDEFMTRLAALVRRPPGVDCKPAPFVPIIGSGRTRFQPIWVGDLAECIVRALGSPDVSDQIVEVGGPEQVTYEALVDIVMDTLNIRRPKVHVPVALMRPAVALMPLVYRDDPPITSTQLGMIELDSVAETDVVERVFGFPPARLRDKLGYLAEASR